MRKICIITGTRAEYGLLYWLMKEIRKTQILSCRLLTARHGSFPDPAISLRDQENYKQPLRVLRTWFALFAARMIYFADPSCSKDRQKKK